MQFSAVVTEVARLTKRPDLVDDIKREVNSSINFCCIEGNFARDIVEDLIATVPDSYVQSFPLTSFERFRKLLYVRPVDSKCYINPMSADTIFSGGKESLNVYYIAGSTVKMKLKNLSNGILMGWYQYPPELTILAGDFWLLDVSPYMIIDRTAAAIFTQVGNTTESQKHEAKFAVAFESARRDYKYGVNYG